MAVFGYMVQAQSGLDIFVFVSSALSGLATLFLFVRHTASQTGTDTVNSLVADNKALQTIIESHRKRESVNQEELLKLAREIGEIKGMIRVHTEISPAERSKIERRLMDVSLFLQENQEASLGAMTR